MCPPKGESIPIVLEDAFIDAAERFAVDDKNTDFVREVVSAEFKWRSAYDRVLIEQTPDAYAAEVSAAAIADDLTGEAASIVAALVQR